MIRTETILAIDPGKKTGWAVLTLNGTYTGGEGLLHDILAAVETLLIEGRRPIIVCEDFIFTTATAKKSRQTWSTEGIGVLRYLAARYQVSFIIQSPNSAKNFASDDKLKAMGWYHPTEGGHRNDAARHLLLYADGVERIDRKALFNAID